MENSTLLVLATPTERELAMLEQLPDETNITVGDRAEAFENSAAQADVILSWSKAGELLRDVLAMTPHVRWVHSRSAGLDSVLFPELVEHHVTLTNGRGVFSEPLGEFAIAAALFFAKDLRRMVRSHAAGVWDQFDIELIAGRTLGVVGYGDIGRAVARRAKAMGMRVVAVRRRPELSRGDSDVDEVYSPERLREMLAGCDYVVVSAPLTAETRSMISAGELAVMKRTAVLVNVGRGPVVDEPALVDALERGAIRGAALDVFDQEPLPDGHPFYKLENVLLSPHCADHTPDWLERAMRFFLENFERYRTGRPLLNVVDKSLGY